MLHKPMSPGNARRQGSSPPLRTVPVPHTQCLAHDVHASKWELTGADGKGHLTGIVKSITINITGICFTGLLVLLWIF